MSVSNTAGRGEDGGAPPPDRGSHQVQVSPRSLSVAVDGRASSFPSTGRLRSFLEGLDCVSLVPGRSFRPPSKDELRRALPPVKYPAVRSVFAVLEPGDLPLGGGTFLEPRELRRAAAASALVATARHAASLGVGCVVLDLDTAEGEGLAARGREEPSDPLGLGTTLPFSPERVTERLCRTLHSVLAAVPDTVLCLRTTRRDDSLLRPTQFRWVIDDLGDRVRYWHDTSRAFVWQSRGGPGEGEWLAALADRCVGVDLVDAAGEVSDLPPGSGEVDFRPLRTALAAGVVWCLPLEITTPAPLARTAIDHLRQVLGVGGGADGR